MVYKTEMVKDVNNNAELHYILQGVPDENANLQITLRVRFVRIQGGMKGLVVDPYKSTLPKGVSLSQLDEDDAINTLVEGVLTKVWLADGNGIGLKYRGTYYPLFNIQDVNDQGARVYFDYLPIEFGKGQTAGHIVLDGKVWLESAPKKD